MTRQSHYIRIDPFDREYGLADLLEPDRVAVFFRQAEADGLLRLAVRHPDGTRYFPVETSPPRRPGGDSDESGEMTLPLRHELETVGFLHVRKGRDTAPEAFAGVAAMARTVLEALMMERYRYLMSSRLHGEVVEDSYLRLRQKADALAESEARYRRLAARLEKEVARQAEEIRNTQARLMERAQLAAIGQLAAGMAHEINNPMGFISSNLNTLDQYGADLTALLAEARGFWRLLAEVSGDGEAWQTLGRKAAALDDTARRLDLDYLLADLPLLIRESREGGERIRAIVANLKTFAQPGVEARGALDLNRCLQTTLQVMAPLMAGRVTPVCRFQALPDVLGSESQLNLAFMNVILNAVQASPAGGEIRLSTNAAADHVTICIADDGPGIPAEMHGRVFEPFYTTRTVGEGCGLGLTLAYNTIRNHGGTIQVLSAPGKGTSMAIRLPIDGRG